MDKPKFKIGDKIMCVGCINYKGCYSKPYKAGKIYTVKYVWNYRVGGPYYDTYEVDVGEFEEAFVSIDELGELSKILYE